MSHRKSLWNLHNSRNYKANKDFLKQGGQRDTEIALMSADFNDGSRSRFCLGRIFLSSKTKDAQKTEVAGLVSQFHEFAKVNSK